LHKKIIFRRYLLRFYLFLIGVQIFLNDVAYFMYCLYNIGPVNERNSNRKYARTCEKQISRILDLLSHFLSFSSSLCFVLFYFHSLHISLYTQNGQCMLFLALFSFSFCNFGFCNARMKPYTFNIFVHKIYTIAVSGEGHNRLWHTKMIFWWLFLVRKFYS
jgi:hypothetical protein